MEPIETIEHKGFTIEIHQDEEPESPREWDNLGTMICFHRRYDLGDKHDWPVSREGYEEFEEFLRKNAKTLITLPLYLYDHSGLRMKVGSFQGLLPQGHAEFDNMSGESISGGGLGGLRDLVKDGLRERGKVMLILDAAYQFAVSIGVYIEKEAERKAA